MYSVYHFEHTSDLFKLKETAANMSTVYVGQTDLGLILPKHHFGTK